MVGFAWLVTLTLISGMVNHNTKPQLVGGIEMRINDQVHFKRMAGWCQGHVTAIDGDIVYVTTCLGGSSYTFHIDELTTRDQYKKLKKIANKEKH